MSPKIGFIAATQLDSTRGQNIRQVISCLFAITYLKDAKFLRAPIRRTWPATSQPLIRCRSRIELHSVIRCHAQDESHRRSHTACDLEVNEGLMVELSRLRGTYVQEDDCTNASSERGVLTTA
jgi:hypothetical protein